MNFGSIETRPEHRGEILSYNQTIYLHPLALIAPLTTASTRHPPLAAALVLLPLTGMGLIKKTGQVR